MTHPTPESRVAGRPSDRSQAAEWDYWQRNRLEHWTHDWRRYLNYFPFDKIDFGSQSVLDVGSGPVSILEYVAPPAADVCAVDALADNYNTLVPDKRIAIQSELPDRTFDIALLLNALDHMEDPGELLDVICARVKPGGELWLHVHIERPYPSDEHPQRFSFRGLNRLLGSRFTLRRVRIYRDGPVWPYAWCAIATPGASNLGRILLADVTCAIARAWVFTFRAAIKGIKVIGMRSALPARYH